ncbi:hypothetical protein [Pseudomonas putida]|uniref:hypothetical protein n=1 Tax=Pseudomonas putida TaxID=303 RepID=UPI002B23F61A|nr:hypothetical protein [Pseudomonas putida]
MVAALRGLGCALLREPLLVAARDSGELIRMFDHELDDGRAYYLCRRTDGELSREGLNLYNWIRMRF